MAHPVEDSERDPIAVVGLACRLPGADGPDELWDLLAQGRDAIEERRPYRIRSGAELEPRLRPLVRFRGQLGDVERFDWRAFRISQREAGQIDPQHRLLLELAGEALEDAGIDAGALAGLHAGVFTGLLWQDWARLAASRPQSASSHTLLGLGAGMAAHRIAHVYDLRGPAVAVDGQQASSLLAIHLACRSLRSGDCDLAVAGGANLILDSASDALLARMGVLSARGRCRPMDADADGIVRGEGGGAVVLRPLSRAMAAGDRVRGVILGSATNHDGRRASLSAASDAAQADVLERAWRDAGVSAGGIDYVELHGTGTPAGDRAEAGALATALGRSDRRDPCLLGSLKSNIGHTEAAAGVAGLIKTVLALARGEIPPTLHHATPIAQVADSPLLEVVDRRRPWPDRRGPRLAGVTGVSLGGGNVHLVLGAPPPGARRR